MCRRICVLMKEEYATALSNHLDTSQPPSSCPSPSTETATTTTAATFGGSPSSSLPPQTPSVAGVPTEPFFHHDRDLIRQAKSGVALGSMFDLLGHKPTPEGVPQVTPRGSNSLASTPQHSAPPSPSSSQQPWSSSSTTTKPPRRPIDPTASRRDDFSKRSFHLKPVFIEAIQELMDEVEMTYRSVGEQSIDHIHSGYAPPFPSCIAFSSLIAD